MSENLVCLSIKIKPTNILIEKITNWILLNEFDPDKPLVDETKSIYT